ncbi:hypothetical protein V2O64_21380 [Verrucomicrobiaceae bacterium 227]
MRRTGMLRDKPDVEYQLLGEDGEVTSYALDAAGLNYDDRGKVKEIVDQSLDELSKALAEKVRYNEELSAEDRGYYVYDIPTFEEDGTAVLEKLSSRLQDHYGDDASKALIAGLHTDRHFAGFGKFESRVIFDDHGSLVNKLDGGTQFDLTIKDPKTGRILSEIRSTKHSLHQTHLGSAFIKKTER